MLKNILLINLFFFAVQPDFVIKIYPSKEIINIEISKENLTPIIDPLRLATDNFKNDILTNMYIGYNNAAKAAEAKVPLTIITEGIRKDITEANRTAYNNRLAPWLNQLPTTEPITDEQWKIIQDIMYNLTKSFEK